MLQVPKTILLLQRLMLGFVVIVVVVLVLLMLLLRTVAILCNLCSNFLLFDFKNSLFEQTPCQCLKAKPLICFTNLKNHPSVFNNFIYN